ncbi:hypothetical protein EJB05_00128, partial [Eragrostis curvula]
GIYNARLLPVAVMVILQKSPRLGRETGTPSPHEGTASSRGRRWRRRSWHRCRGVDPLKPRLPQQMACSDPARIRAHLGERGKLESAGRCSAPGRRELRSTGSAPGRRELRSTGSAPAAGHRELRSILLNICSSVAYSLLK